MGQESVFCFLQRLLQSVYPPVFYKICLGSYSSEDIGDCWGERTLFSHFSVKNNLTYISVCIFKRWKRCITPLQTSSRGWGWQFVGRARNTCSVLCLNFSISITKNKKPTNNTWALFSLIWRLSIINVKDLGNRHISINSGTKTITNVYSKARTSGSHNIKLEWNFILFLKAGSCVAYVSLQLTI